MADVVRLTKQGAVAIVTIDRPEALNALNSEVIGAVGTAIDQIEAAEDAMGARREGLGLERRHVPVSYTHLTLPTICSV